MGINSKVAISSVYKSLEQDENLIEGIASSINRALKQASISINDENSRNIGLFLSTSFSNFDLRYNNYECFLEKGLRAMNPALAPKGLISYLGGQVCIACNIKGAQSTVSSGVSGGFDAILGAMYFLDRDKNNKAIIVELGESFNTKPSCLIKGNCCFVLENSKQKNLGSILAIESFFEKKGDNKGLSKAVEEAIKKAFPGSPHLDYLFLSDDSYLQIKSLKELVDASKTKVFACNKQDMDYSSNLLSIIDVFKEGSKGIAMIINKGQDTNSSCMIFEIKARR